MINALKGLGHNQFEWARWSPKVYTSYKLIKARVMSDREKRFSTVLENLMIEADSMVVITAYKYPYKPRQHLNFRCKWWEIVSVADLTEDINEQSLALVKGGSALYALELKEADGYDA